MPTKNRCAAPQRQIILKKPCVAVDTVLYQQRMCIAMPSRGFTLVELVTVILIVSVLAVFVVPRFLGSSAFEGRTVQEQLISAAREAQQLAMDKGTGAAVTLEIDDGNKRVRIRYNEGGPQTIDYSVPDGITLVSTAPTISYSTLGDASTAMNVSIIGAGTRNVCIEDSGYAHAC